MQEWVGSKWRVFYFFLVRDVLHAVNEVDLFVLIINFDKP